MMMMIMIMIMIMTMYYIIIVRYQSVRYTTIHVTDEPNIYSS